MTRPVILGMATSRPDVPPLSTEDGAGRRLFLLSGMTEADYLAAFDRVNLLPFPWKKHAAREVGWAARASLEGRRVLVLGREVWAALGLPGQTAWFETVRGFTLLPHPSGRSTVLNLEKRRIEMRKTIRKAARR